jgi:hypothetical protein
MFWPKGGIVFKFCCRKLYSVYLPQHVEFCQEHSGALKMQRTKGHQRALSLIQQDRDARLQGAGLLLQCEESCPSTTCGSLDLTLSCPIALASHSSVGDAN